MKNSNGGICLQSKLYIPSNDELNDLEHFCEENGVDYSCYEIRSGVQNSILDSIYLLLINQALITAIVTGLISNATYEFLKYKISKAVLKIKSTCPVKTKISVIKMKSHSAELLIESDEITSENISEAFDAFVKVSSLNNDNQPCIPTYIVAGEKPEILTQDDFIKKYLINKDK
jgi:hypothetical protein